MDKPWKVLFAFLGVFIAGAVFGGFFALGVGRKIWEMETPPPAKMPVATTVTPATAATPTQKPATPAQQQQPPQRVPEPQSVQSAQLMRRVTNQLNLTAAQKAQVAPIIQRAVQDFWREQQNYSRENAFLLQRLKQDIAKELTPEQQTKLEDLWLKQLELFRKKQAEAQAQARAAAPQPSQPQAVAKPAADTKSGTPDSADKSTSASTPKPPGDEQK